MLDIEDTLLASEQSSTSSSGRVLLQRMCLFWMDNGNDVVWWTSSFSYSYAMLICTLNVS